jgi:hypothetical protein
MRLCRGVARIADGWTWNRATSTFTHRHAKGKETYGRMAARPARSAAAAGRLPPLA